MFTIAGSKKTLLVFVFLFTSYFASAQFNQSAFENRIRPDSSLTNEVRFNFYNLNYVRNYEYTNDFHDGYTCTERNCSHKSFITLIQILPLQLGHLFAKISDGMA